MESSVGEQQDKIEFSADTKQEKQAHQQNLEEMQSM